MTSTAPTWDDFRREMPVTENWAYFDHAAIAPLPASAKAAIEQLAADAALNGDHNWPNWRKNVERVRNAGAELIHAQQSEIAVVRNTTEGISLVAEGFPWQAGDNVVVPESEFPSNLYPWLNLQSRGVEVRQVPVENERLDLNRVHDLCDERTRIVAASWVGYQTGWRNDVDALADLAHRNGALFFLDAIQGLGVLPLDVSQTPVDFLAADGHKWLLGPEGAGLFYLREEHLDLLRPIGVGWNSVKQAGDFADPTFDLKPSAGRYEGGSYNMLGIAGLAAALELLLSHGIDRIASRLLDVTDRLCQQLQSIGAEIDSCREAERRSGIVAFRLPGRDPREIHKQCPNFGVILNCRAGRVRVSPHAYNNQEEIDRLITALES